MSARHPGRPDSSFGFDRRKFLAATGTGLLAAAIPGSHRAETAAIPSKEANSSRSPQVSSGAKRKFLSACLIPCMQIFRWTR